MDWHLILAIFGLVGRLFLGFLGVNVFGGLMFLGGWWWGLFMKSGRGTQELFGFVVTFLCL
jgi:hypothetical protein